MTKQKKQKRDMKQEGLEFTDDFQDWELVANIKGIQNPKKAYSVFRRRSQRNRVEWHCTCSAPHSVWCYHKREAVKVRRKKHSKPETKIVF